MKSSLGWRHCLLGSLWIASHSFLHTTISVGRSERFTRSHLLDGTDLSATPKKNKKKPKKAALDEGATFEETVVVSDAEAILACWSFLTRHKRAGNWTQMERRQMQLASAQPHYFWEETDITQERQQQQQQQEEEDELLDEYADDHAQVRLRPNHQQTNNEEIYWSGEFTSFPTEPSQTRVRRSLAAKRTWQDPEFRERWREARWGGRQSQEEIISPYDKELEQRVLALPTGFLGSPELLAMTEAEMEAAIQTYVKARHQRVASRTKTLTDRKALLADQMQRASSSMGILQVEERISRDALFTQDDATLREAQRARSERAKLAYAKRVEKKPRPKGSSSAATKRKSVVKQYQPNSATPQDALLRVQVALNAGLLPSSTDVEIIRQPLKLAKRRGLLREILSDFFDLRGKCVPIRDSRDETATQFVTQSAIDDLGAFVVGLILSKEGTMVEERNDDK